MFYLAAFFSLITRKRQRCSRKSRRIQSTRPTQKRRNSLERFFPTAHNLQGFFHTVPLLNLKISVCDYFSLCVIPCFLSNSKNTNADFLSFFFIIGIFILLSRESDQCAVRARLGVAGHLSTTLRGGNSVECLSQRHNK